MKQIGTVVVVLSLVMVVGYVFGIQYLSGSPVGTYQLALGGRKSVGPIMLTPEMTPLRVLLNVRYRRTFVSVMPQVTYSVILKDAQGTSMWERDGRFSARKKDSKSSGRKRTRRRTHSKTEAIRRFEIGGKGEYTFDTEVSAQQVDLVSAELRLRRNVKTVNPWIAGACGVPGLIGLLLIALGGKKGRV